MAVEWTPKEGGGATVVLTEEDAEHYAYLAALVEAGVYDQNHKPVRDGLRIIEYLNSLEPGTELAAVVTEPHPTDPSEEVCRIVCVYPEQPVQLSKH